MEELKQKLFEKMEKELEKAKEKWVEECLWENHKIKESDAEQHFIEELERFVNVESQYEMEPFKDFFDLFPPNSYWCEDNN